MSSPLFLFHAFHGVHTPLEAPYSALEAFNFIETDLSKKGCTRPFCQSRSLSLSLSHSLSFSLATHTHPLLSSLHPPRVRFPRAGSNYAAIVTNLDAIVGRIVDALKTKQMYKDTLIVFCSDNGGPIYYPGSANNYPLLGGKYSDFEGGVRTFAFISGGALPSAVRGAYTHLVKLQF